MLSDIFLNVSFDTIIKIVITDGGGGGGPIIRAYIIHWLRVFLQYLYMTYRKGLPYMISLCEEKNSFVWTRCTFTIMTMMI